MMQQSGRFITSQIYRQALIQESCPVYVHCSRLCTDSRTGDRFLQVRLVNRTDRQIDNVFLCVDGLDAWGNPCGQLAGLILPDCKAQPHSIFGEERMIAVGKLRAAKLNITVERVSFYDGMLWRGRAASLPQPLEETDWQLCACGLPHAPGQELCDLCGRRLGQADAPTQPPVQTAVVPAVPLPEAPAQQAAEESADPLETVFEMPPVKPAPILRSEEELSLCLGQYESSEESGEEEDEGVPRWLFILLCVIGGTALLAAVLFLVYFLRNAPMI